MTCAACESAAKIAEASTYPEPASTLARSGRGWMWGQHVQAAWRQAGHRIAREIRGACRHPALCPNHATISKLCDGYCAACLIDALETGAYL